MEVIYSQLLPRTRKSSKLTDLDAKLRDLADNPVRRFYDNELFDHNVLSVVRDYYEEQPVTFMICDGVVKKLDVDKLNDVVSFYIFKKVVAIRTPSGIWCRNYEEKYMRDTAYNLIFNRLFCGPCMRVPGIDDITGIILSIDDARVIIRPHLVDFMTIGIDIYTFLGLLLWAGNIEFRFNCWHTNPMTYFNNWPPKGYRKKISSVNKLSKRKGVQYLVNGLNTLCEKDRRLIFPGEPSASKK